MITAEFRDSKDYVIAKYCIDIAALNCNTLVIDDVLYDKTGSLLVLESGEAKMYVYLKRHKDNP